MAKALALGADAVSIGVAALIALGDNAPEHDAEYRKLGSAAGFYDDWHAGLDPVNMEPEDLVALTVEAAAMARVPLAGTSWVPGA